MIKSIQKFELSLELLFLEMYGYGARFEKLAPEISSLRDKAFQIESMSGFYKLDHDGTKSKQLVDAQDSLSSAFFSAGALIDELEEVIRHLEDAHSCISELANAIVAEQAQKANDAKAQNSAFSR